MKKLLSVVALLSCFAGSLYAEGYLYPTGPNGGPPQSCPGCPAPRTSDNSTTLEKVWPYSDPIVGFHRYLDSLWIKDWQQPIRTARAFKTMVVPSRNRIYMRIGGGMLVLLGLLLLTGLWDGLMIWLRAWLAATGLGASFL